MVITAGADGHVAFLRRTDSTNKALPTKDVGSEILLREGLFQEQVTWIDRRR